VSGAVGKEGGGGENLRDKGVDPTVRRVEDSEKWVVPLALFKKQEGGGKKFFIATKRGRLLGFPVCGNGARQKGSAVGLRREREGMRT